MPYPHTLPQLPYPYDALEPYIDKATMEIHHTKHHQGYVDKLNKALEGHENLHNKDVVDLLMIIEDLPSEVKTAVRNHGGGHSNHSLFWPSLSPEPEKVKEPVGDLATAINDVFGSFKDFKKQFNDEAAGVFGSGWAWLVISSTGTLDVTTTPNQDSPYMNDQKPLLGLDVWEHAYYLKYQNKRAEYIEQWWNVVNWAEIEGRFGKDNS